MKSTAWPGARMQMMTKLGATMMTVAFVVKIYATACVNITLWHGLS
jgi:hypothetical protein